MYYQPIEDSDKLEWEKVFKDSKKKIKIEYKYDLDKEIKPLNQKNDPHVLLSEITEQELIKKQDMNDIYSL